MPGRPTTSSFRAGEWIVEQGDPGETLFVIMEGQAKVIRDGKVRTHLVPSDFFGEISVLDGGPRTASVVAETQVSALRVFRRTVLEMVGSEPALALGLLEGIARRIREIDRSLPLTPRSHASDGPSAYTYVTRAPRPCGRARPAEGMELRDSRPMPTGERLRDDAHPEGGGSMRAKIVTFPWRRLLFTAATLATMLLAAGAKWRPS